MNTLRYALPSMSLLLLLAGCVDTKPLQDEVHGIETRVTALQSKVAAVKSSADSAAQAASNAQASADRAAQSASAAQSTANQALSAAQAAQSSIDATNVKIDRMFQHKGAHHGAVHHGHHKKAKQAS